MLDMICSALRDFTAWRERRKALRDLSREDPRIVELKAEYQRLSKHHRPRAHVVREAKRIRTERLRLVLGRA